MVCFCQGTFFKSNLEPSALQAPGDLNDPFAGRQKGCGREVLGAGFLRLFQHTELEHTPKPKPVQL